MDCMRLFTKEDVLDGDEKPVSHLPRQRKLISQSPLGGRLARELLDLAVDLSVSPCQPCLSCFSDVLSLPSQKTLYKEVLRPEVPKDLGAPYPSDPSGQGCDL